MPLVILAALFLYVFAFRRAESLGTLLILLAGMLLAWLVTGHAVPLGPSPLVQALGMHALTVALGFGVAGSAIRFSRPSRVILRQRVLCGAPLAVLLTAAGLSLLRPDILFGDTSLSEVSAGGRAGLLLTGSHPGMAVCSAIALAFVRVTWPESPSLLARLAARLWRRLWRGTVTTVRALCPVDPAPDEEPEPLPDWFLAEEEQEDAEDPDTQEVVTETVAGRS